MKSSSFKHSNGYTTVNCIKSVAIGVCKSIRALKTVPYYHLNRSGNGITGLTVKLPTFTTKELFKSS